MNGRPNAALNAASERSSFPHITTYEDAELFELAAPLDDQGTMLSLLWIPGR